MDDLPNGISIVVPVYNSEMTLRPLVGHLLGVLPGLGVPYEILLVNDGSRDASGTIIQSLAEEYPWVTGIQLARNYGQHNATLCGVRAAQYDVLITMDDDLQHPAENIRLLISKLNEGFDVVYGTPKRETHSRWRNAASVITKLALQATMGIEAARGVSAFRAFRTRIRDAFAEYRGTFVSIDVLLTWGTTRFGAVRIDHTQRPEGRSNYTFWMLLRHAINMITGFSTVPLQIASLVGFSFTLVGIAVLIWVVGRYLVEGGAVPGFPFLASIVAIFAGAQLFALGIIGEYLARMHFQAMQRPTYVVRAVSKRATEAIAGVHDRET